MKITIDKNDRRPAYQQIADRIVREVETGRLKAGDSLPTERDLSELAGLARGTVKRAYDILLAEGRIVRRQGSGTFISSDDASPRAVKSRRGARLAAQLIDELEGLSLTPGEIEAFIGMDIRRRREMTRRQPVAVIDCNYETLRVIVNQLKQFPGLEVVEFLVAEVEKFPEKLSYGFELVLTTPTHYDRVLELAPFVTDRTLKIVISPSEKSVLNLHRIQPGSRVGLWHVSLEFASILRCHISDLGKNVSISHRLETETLPLKAFIAQKDALIIPAGYPAGATPGDAALLADFKAQGGLIIESLYSINRGSLIYLREELRRRWPDRDVTAPHPGGREQASFEGDGAAEVPARPSGRSITAATAAHCPNGARNP